jgi:Domain of unknown function (DUF397)
MAIQPDRDPTRVWHKSSASGGSGNCVEIACSESSVLVRDSGDGTEAILEFSPEQWRGFVRRIKNGKVPLG